MSFLQLINFSYNILTLPIYIIYKFIQFLYLDKITI